jgi:hypothetical protein
MLTTLPGLAFATDIRVQKTPAAKTINPAHPAAAKLPADKSKLALKRGAKILAMDFRTEPSGKWLFTYDVQNTGFATLNLRNAQFKTTQILENGNQIPVHTVNTGSTLAPGQNVTGCYAWNRCSTASQLRLEVFYEGAMLDAKTVIVPPIDVNITRGALGKTGNKWSASLKNLTGNTVKVAVRPISDTGQAGQDIVKTIPGNGTAQCTGLSNFSSTRGIQVVFRDETPCSQPGYVVLDTHNLSSKPTIGSGHSQPGDRTSIQAVLESITWHRPSKQWVATVRNNTALPLSVGIAGWPLENGVQGMTVWSNETIPAGDTVLLLGDYSGYSVPPGTRLKVHVLLKPSNTKVHEKIIVLN